MSFSDLFWQGDTLWKWQVWCVLACIFGNKRMSNREQCLSISWKGLGFFSSLSSWLLFCLLRWKMIFQTKSRLLLCFPVLESFGRQVQNLTFLLTLWKYTSVLAHAIPYVFYYPTEVSPMAVFSLVVEWTANFAPSCQPIIFFHYFWSAPLENSHWLSRIRFKSIASKFCNLFPFHWWDWQAENMLKCGVTHLVHLSRENVARINLCCLLKGLGSFLEVAYNIFYCLS